MARSKAERSPAQKLVMLESYMQSLEAGTATQPLPTVGDLLGSRVDRVRLWKSGNEPLVKVMDVTLPKRPHRAWGKAKKVRSSKDTDLLQIMDEIDDPEIAVDLTMDMESGAVSLAVEMEPALVGQDLSLLAKAGAGEEYPTFEDEPFDNAYWSAEEAAEEFGVAKTTITRRIKKNELIGFRLFKNALYVPKDQMVGHLPIKGLSDVLRLFGNEHYEAWKFLTSSVFYGEETPRPLDRLKACKSEEALKACLSELEAAKEGFDYGDHM